MAEVILDVKTIKSPNDVPTYPHWALLKHQRIDIGSNDLTPVYKDCWEYTAFAKKEQWELEIQRLVRNGEAKTFMAFESYPVSFTVQVKVNMTGS